MNLFKRKYNLNELRFISSDNNESSNDKLLISECLNELKYITA